jgi:CRP-like cAMP-binding protein
MTQSTSTVAGLLSKTPLFSALDEADRQTVAERMLRTEFRPNGTVFARGDAGRDVFLVLVGCVRLSVFSADGRLLSFKHATPGDIFGEIAALDGGPRTADAVALTRVVAMTLARDRLQGLLDDNPRLALAAVAWLCRRLRDTTDQVTTIALEPVEMRLARYLLSRMAPDGPDAAGAKRLIEPGISQSEIASLIGASRQKVNAALGLLEEAGAIARSGRRIAGDAAALARIAAAD